MDMELSAFDDFDEQFYCEKYPDIAQAIERGDLKCGLDHYRAFGRNEGRQRFRGFDTEWYYRAYPLVKQEVAAGLAKSSFDHYDRIGRFRGYLPFGRALRPANGGEFHSRFGGFWTDLGNAADLMRGKLELGLITPEQAALLTHWIEHGFVILKSGIAPEILDRAQEVLESAYLGLMPALKFLCEPVSKSTAPWSDKLLGYPAKAVDVHWLSQSVRDLIFSKAVVDFLHLVFERRVMVTQSLTFWLGSSQQVHQDGAYVPYSIPMLFAVSWIALEDVAVDAGELYYYPGSHRFRDYEYGGGHKSLQEARRADPTYNGDAEAKEHVSSLSLRAEAVGLPQEVLLAKRGDVLIWHANLAHGGRPVSPNRTRKSVVTHYCPAEVAPLYFERQKREIRRNADGSYYATQYYDSE